MNMENMNYDIRNLMNAGRNEEPQYDMNAMDMLNNTNNQNYMINVNGAALNNAYQQNEYMNEMEKYPAEMMSQMKLEQAMNSYNNTVSMNNATMPDPNEAMSMQAMKANMDTQGYESYRNLMNYNNTQNTIKTNQVPMNVEDFNNNEGMYMNQNGAEMYPEEFINNLPTTNDAAAAAYASNYQIQNQGYNPMAQNNYNNMQYQMSGYENMTNPQMFMQSMPQKQTRHVPLPRITPSMQHSIPPSMQAQMAPCMTAQMAPTTSIRRVPALNKRRIKPKKFFPCC